MLTLQATRHGDLGNISEEALSTAVIYAMLCDHQCSSWYPNSCSVAQTATSNPIAIEVWMRRFGGHILCSRVLK
jgi:hypothetical protein